MFDTLSPEDEEILSAELLYLDADILAEFQSQCEAAAETSCTT